MQISNRRESVTLFVGDILILLLSLWLTYGVRNSSLPNQSQYLSLLLPFSIIILISLLCFFIAGLYEKPSVILRSRLPFRIFRTQIINSMVAVLVFYFIPYFGITPKTILFIYLIISFLLILLWRSYLFRFVVIGKVENAMIIGAGIEMEELINEINKSPTYGMRFVDQINLDSDISTLGISQKIADAYQNKSISIIVIDLDHDFFNTFFYGIGVLRSKQ